MWLLIIKNTMLKNWLMHQRLIGFLEKDLTASGFVKETRHLLSHEDVLKNLASHAKALGKPHACEDIYQEILKTLERK